LNSCNYTTDLQILEKIRPTNSLTEEYGSRYQTLGPNDQIVRKLRSLKVCML
jgi:hypothetical protein